MFFIHFFQTCFIYMAMGSLDLTTVALVPGKMVMRQKLDMILFRTVQWSLERTRKFEKEGVIMRIVMKRKITTEMMTTYFPSILLTMITFATTFFKPFFFEAALSVNLTTMLVMTTIFISKMEGLPSTSFMKMIDIWLIICQLVPFVEVVLFTAKEYVRSMEEDGEVKNQRNQAAPGIHQNMDSSSKRGTTLNFTGKHQAVREATRQSCHFVIKPTVIICMLVSNAYMDNEI